MSNPITASLDKETPQDYKFKFDDGDSILTVCLDKELFTGKAQGIEITINKVNLGVLV